MKEAFVDKTFRADTLEVIELCEAVLEEYAKEGYDLTLRQLYYQMIARDLFPASWVDVQTGTKNNQKNYNRLGSIVNDARLAGLMDWDMIVDRVRSTERNSHWAHPGAILKASARWFAIDKWQDQPVHVEVMCEKQALEGVLLPVCEELDIGFTSNRGYTSQSFMYRKGKELARRLEEEKEVVILYLGDHDPSGLDMDRDVHERLRMFATKEFFDDLDPEAVRLERIALTMPQIKKYQPPPNPAKTTDSRYAAYIRQHGDESWELDAIEPRALAKLVRRAVEALLDEDLWEQACEDERAMKEELEEMASKYDGTRWAKLWADRKRARE